MKMKTERRININRRLKRKGKKKRRKKKRKKKDKNKKEENKTATSKKEENASLSVFPPVQMCVHRSRIRRGGYIVINFTRRKTK